MGDASFWLTSSVSVGSSAVSTDTFLLRCLFLGGRRQEWGDVILSHTMILAASSLHRIGISFLLCQKPKFILVLVYYSEQIYKAKRWPKQKLQGSFQISKEYIALPFAHNWTVSRIKSDKWRFCQWPTWHNQFGKSAEVADWDHLPSFHVVCIWSQPNPNKREKDQNRPEGFFWGKTCECDSRVGAQGCETTLLTKEFQFWPSFSWK